MPIPGDPPPVPDPPSDPPPLPPLPGPARAILLPVHPRQVYLYWVRDARLDTGIESHGGAAELRLEFSRDGAAFHEVLRGDFDFRAPGWYVAIPAMDGHLRARLGMRRGGAFRELLVTNTIRVPRAEPPAAVIAGGAAIGMPAPAFDRAEAPGPSASSPGKWLRGTAEAAGRAGIPPPAAGRGAPAAVAGYLCLVLHAHMPFVRHPEREFFLEEQWLFETITETYLPLLDVLDHLHRDSAGVRLTLSLTPTLLGMLRDPALMGKYERHLESRCDLARREVARTRRDPDFGPIAGFYHDRLERLRHLFAREYRRDLVGRFALLEAEGLLEIIACAATHAFLPLLAPDPRAVRAQIEVGVAEHRRQIGRAPRGLWLPECGYFEGLDRILKSAGIRYFFLDGHALRNASPAPAGVHAPVRCPSGTAAFGRDEECSVQVWSAELGYPGDPFYRDFYRDIGYDLDHSYVAPFLDPAGNRGMTGFKYHRITGRSDRKEPYRRERALRTLARHAADFVARRAEQAARLRPAMDRPPVMVAMYDAELFGHWWFEGPEWLECVLRALPRSGIRALTPGDYLEEHPGAPVAEPSASSWGEGGYSSVWLNSTNDWILPHLHAASARMAGLLERLDRPGRLERRILAQAGRELLLAQASDWPFILKNRTAVDYARRRVHEHLHRFDRLARQIEAGRPDPGALAGLESLDNLFPDLDAGAWGRG